MRAGSGGGGNDFPTLMEEFSLFVHNTNVVSVPVMSLRCLKK